MSSLPGPSSLKRVSECVASEALPHVYSEGGEPAWRGSVIHAFLTAVGTYGRQPALAMLSPEYRPVCEAIDLDRLPPLSTQAAAMEVSFAFNVWTGECRETGRDLTREEARSRAAEDELPGTADWLAALSSTSGVVLDWKTGWREVDAAEVNWQARTYGVMASRCYGWTSVWVGLVRIMPDGRPVYDVVEMDAMDLEAHESELRALLERRQATIDAHRRGEPLPPFMEGSHCHFCPAYSYCGAKVNLLRSVLADGSGPPEIVQQTPNQLSPESAAKLWLQLEQAEGLVERMKSTLKGYVRANGPIQMSGGYVLGERPVQTATVRPEIAEGVLSTWLGPEFCAARDGVPMVKVERSITKDELRERIALHLESVWEVLVREQHPEVLGKGGVPKKPAVATAMRAVMDILAVKGGVSFSEYRKVEEYRPDKKGGGRPPAMLPVGQLEGPGEEGGESSGGMEAVGA